MRFAAVRAHGLGHRGGLAALQALLQVVVIRTNQDALYAVGFLQRLGDGGQVARVKRHGHGQAGGGVQCGGGGVALGHQHHGAGIG